MIISLIIPVYNTEKFVEQCILSCINQDLPNDEYEIIVVNDGTQDNSMTIVSSFASQYSNIRVFEQENSGLSAARNTGLKQSRGKYIWFVDSDDWIEFNCLRRLVKKLEDDNLEGLVHAGIRYIDGVTTHGVDVNYDNRVMSGKELMFKYPINCAAVKTIYKRDFLVSNNLYFFEGIYHEDHEFTPRAYYFIDRIEFVNDHVYYNRLTPGSITQKPNPKKAFDLIVVAKQLYAFKERHNMDGVGQAFDYLVGSAINQSLSNSTYMSENEKNKLNALIRSNSYLLKSFLYISNMKYKLEGLLFYFFPKHIVKIYSLIHK